MDLYLQENKFLSKKFGDKFLKKITIYNLY